jgi:hypothetical protein
MLQLEARRLGIEAESFDNEELLQAVYKAMKARHFAAVNPNEKSD